MDWIRGWWRERETANSKNYLGKWIATLKGITTILQFREETKARKGSSTRMFPPCRKKTESVQVTQVTKLTLNLLSTDSFFCFGIQLCWSGKNCFGSESLILLISSSPWLSFLDWNTRCSEDDYYVTITYVIANYLCHIYFTSFVLRMMFLRILKFLKIAIKGFGKYVLGAVKTGCLRNSSDQNSHLQNSRTTHKNSIILLLVFHWGF